MDTLDEQLVQLLGQDARQSSELLAKQLHVSPVTIRRRIRKLLQDGAIRIAAVVDTSKIGFPLAAVIAFNVSHDKLDKATQVLTKYKEITWCTVTTGRFDIIAIARFRSTDELYEFMRKEMTKIEGLMNTETFLSLAVKKGRYLPVYTHSL